MIPDLKEIAKNAVLLTAILGIVLYIFEVSPVWLRLFPALTDGILIGVATALISFAAFLSRFKGNDEQRGKVFYRIGGVSIIITLVASASLALSPIPKENSDGFLAARQLLLQAIGMFGGIFGTSSFFHGIRLFSDHYNKK